MARVSVTERLEPGDTLCPHSCPQKQQHIRCMALCALTHEQMTSLNAAHLCVLTFTLQCHRAGVVHGDIKSNNVLVTSWNWLVLADFTGLKPAYLPEDNPADLSFFFDVGCQNMLQSVVFLPSSKACNPCHFHHGCHCMPVFITKPVRFYVHGTPVYFVNLDVDACGGASRSRGVCGLWHGVLLLEHVCVRVWHKQMSHAVSLEFYSVNLPRDQWSICWLEKVLMMAEMLTSALPWCILVAG
jgi:serine/threonine protein kinase